MLFKLERLNESVGRGRTVGWCQKWEFELFVSPRIAKESSGCAAESNNGNQRALWMITLTRDLDVLTPSIAASLTAILFAVSNIAKAWNVRAFLVFLVCHGNSSELILF